MFYVMLALRAELRRRGAFASKAEPNLAQLLDLVALGTVADVVKLDRNNRVLVHQGLRRIRAGKASALRHALFRAAGRDPLRAGTYDLGFVAGPRLNAAGRLKDMALGIDGLTTDDRTRAASIARQLDALNRERREIEADMQEAALAVLAHVRAGDSYSLALFDPDWHQGVIGILASRLKDRYHRPVITFARAATASSRAPAAPSADCTCAMRSISFRSATRGSSCASAGMRRQPGSRSPSRASPTSLPHSRKRRGRSLRLQISSRRSRPTAVSRPRTRRSISQHIWKQQTWGQGFRGTAVRRHVRCRRTAHRRWQASQTPAGPRRRTASPHSCSPAPIRYPMRSARFIG